MSEANVNAVPSKRGPKSISVELRPASETASAATAVKSKPVKEGGREFDLAGYFAKIGKAINTAAERHKVTEAKLKWPRTANPHKDEIFSELERLGYRASLENTVLGDVLTVDFTPQSA